MGLSHASVFYNVLSRMCFIPSLLVKFLSIPSTASKLTFPKPAPLNTIQICNSAEKASIFSIVP
jgi:hypothetical protein